MFVEVEGITTTIGGFVEIDSIVRDGDGFIISTSAIANGEILPLSAVEIIAIVEGGPVGPKGDPGIQGPPGIQGIQGPPGASGTNSQVFNEVPTGIRNGINKIFTTHSNFIPRSTQVYRDMLRLTIDNDYIESGANQITILGVLRDTSAFIIDYTVDNTIITT